MTATERAIINHRLESLAGAMCHMSLQLDQLSEHVGDLPDELRGGLSTAARDLARQLNDFADQLQPDGQPQPQPKGTPS